MPYSHSVASHNSEGQNTAHAVPSRPSGCQFIDFVVRLSDCAANSIFQAARVVPQFCPDDVERGFGGFLAARMSADAVDYQKDAVLIIYIATVLVFLANVPRVGRYPRTPFRRDAHVYFRPNANAAVMKIAVNTK